MMRHDGGEARKITDASEGVSNFAFSPDGSWLVYRSGESGQEQLYRLPADDLVGAEPAQLTDGEAGVDQWDFSPDGSRVYFTRPDSFDEDEKKRQRGRLHGRRAERGNAPFEPVERRGRDGSRRAARESTTRPTA